MSLGDEVIEHTSAANVSPKPDPLAALGMPTWMLDEITSHVRADSFSRENETSFWLGEW